MTMTTFWVVFIIAILFCSTVAEALVLSLVIQDRNKYKEIADSYTEEVLPIMIGDDWEYWKEHWD